MSKEEEIKLNTLKQDIEELQNEQQELVSKFDNKNKEIEQAVANYNTKIEALQREGQQVVDKLDNEREQLRGSYQLLKDLIERKQQQLDNLMKGTTEIVNDEKVIDLVKKEILNEAGVDTKPTKSTRKSKTEKETNKTLTEEQVDAINAITKTQSEFKGDTSNQNQSVKNSDIPEYLLDEYKK